MSTPRGGRRQVGNEKRVRDKKENDSSDDEDERDKSHSSNKGAESDLLDTSYQSKGNTSRQYRLRSNDSRQSSPPSTPGSLSSSSPRNSRLYPDLSGLEDLQSSHSDEADIKDISTPSSIHLNSNNSSIQYEARVWNESSNTNTNSFYFWALIAVLFAVVVYLFIPGPAGSPPTLAPFDKYVHNIDKLSQQLPHQKKRLWTTIKASARHILNETQSDYPSVILMASDVRAGDTALCLARLITSWFESASHASSDSSIADIAQFKHLPHVEQKKALDENLHNLFRRHKSVIVNNLQLLSPEAALLLHAYCDNDNAPYKDVLIVLLFYTDGNVQLDPDRPNSFEAYLEEHWSKELHIDKVSAIMSRVANNIVVVTEESKAAIDSVCSNV